MPIRPHVPLLILALAACGESRGDAPAADAPEKRALTGAPAAEPAPAQREGILFAVSTYEGSFSLDPIAIIERGRLKNVWDIESDSAFAARYFARGTRYAVRVAGVPVGEASVLEMTEPGCASRGGSARVTFTSTPTLSEDWEALASDAFGAPAAQPLVRPLNAQEQSWLSTLADSIHASRRIPSAARAQAEAQRLFGVTVPGVDAPVLVGTFNVTVPQDDDTQQMYNLLLLAEARGGGAYEPAYVFHDRDDGETGVRSFLDAVDLDGDGVPELVTRAMYNEGWGYNVLKRRADGWTEVYQGGGGGC